MPVHRTVIATLSLSLALASFLPAQPRPQPQSQSPTPSQIQAPAAPTAQTGTQTGVQTGVQTTPSPETPSGAQPSPPPSAISPLQPLGNGATTYGIQPLVNNPTITPGTLALLELDGRLSQSVAAGGGKAFVSWFAPDAVTLNNGQMPVQGRTNIAATATWTAADYQLTWLAQGASMGPSNDMGYTWGSYEGHSKDKNGQPVVTTGRYITVWRKQPDGSWKIALEASANDAPGAGSCCKLPTP